MCMSLRFVAVGCVLGQFVVANLNQHDADSYPYQLAQSGDKSRVYAECTCEMQSVNSQRQSAFTRSELHRREEYKIAEQRRECENEYRVNDANLGVECLEDEVNLETLQDASRQFEQQRRVEGALVLLVE